jgi:hypothetical protein
MTTTTSKPVDKWWAKDPVLRPMTTKPVDNWWDFHNKTSKPVDKNCWNDDPVLTPMTSKPVDNWWNDDPVLTPMTTNHIVVNNHGHGK